MRRAFPYILFLAALWGGSYALIKIALRDVGPFEISFLRLFLALLVLGPIAWRTGAFAGLRERLRAVIAIGVIQIAIPVTAIAVAEQWIPSSLAGVLNGSVPIFVALLSPIFLPEDRATRTQAAGIALGFAGILLVYGIDLGTGLYASLGVLFMTLSSAGYALGPLLGRRHLDGIAPLGVSTSLVAVSAVATAPTLAFGDIAVPGPGAFAAILLLGVIGTGVAFAIYYRAMRLVGPQRTSIIAYLIPCFSLVYGLPLGERPGPGAVAGLACILGGSALIARRPSR